MKRSRSIAAMAALVALFAVAPGCHRVAPAPVTAAAPKASLYQRIGGADRMDALTAACVTALFADPRVSHFFADSDPAVFRGNFGKFLAQQCGGPKAYVGRDMKTTHTGLGIGDADFDAVIEDLGKACDTAAVPAAEKAELLAMVAPLRREVVGK
jgi:hemoglobin